MLFSALRVNGGLTFLSCRFSSEVQRWLQLTELEDESVVGLLGRKCWWRKLSLALESCAVSAGGSLVKSGWWLKANSWVPLPMNCSSVLGYSTWSSGQWLKKSKCLFWCLLQAVAPGSLSLLTFCRGNFAEGKSQQFSPAYLVYFQSTFKLQWFIHRKAHVRRDKWTTFTPRYPGTDSSPWTGTCIFPGLQVESWIWF